jgi:hypothetical protein
VRIATYLVLLASTVAAADSRRLVEKIADEVLDAQLPQVPRAVDDDDAHRRARYAKDTVLLGSRDQTVDETVEGDVQLIPTIGSIQIDSSRITSLVAGGDQNVVWYTSDVALKSSGAAEGVGEIHGSGSERITQVAVPDGKAWKVVASLIGDEHGSIWGGPPGDIGAATAAGPLAPLLASPKALAAALSADPHTFVLGTEEAERAVGPAAATKLLTSWAKLSLVVDGKVREVETKSYAFVQGHVKWTTKGKDTHWMDAMLVAVPASDGAWKVVCVHYANLR